MAVNIRQEAGMFNCVRSHDLSEESNTTDHEDYHLRWKKFGASWKTNCYMYIWEQRKSDVLVVTHSVSYIFVSSSLVTRSLSFPFFAFELVFLSDLSKT